MLDMLWRAAFRWKRWPRRVTGDSAYGTVENIAAIEKAGIGAYVALKGAGQGRPFFGKREFSYDPEHDRYTCPASELLVPRMRNGARRLIGYRAKIGTCDACSLRARCTTSKVGRQILRHFDEEYVDRVKGYRGTFPYEKAIRKRRVWVEPLFAEAKDWHGMRRFRLRRLEKVNIEALLIGAGQNVKRLLTFGDRRPKKLAQAAALRPPVATGHEIRRAREPRSNYSWRPTRIFFNSAPWPLPGHPETMKMEPPPRLFSHQAGKLACVLTLLAVERCGTMRASA